MRGKTVWGIAICLMTPLYIGCAAAPGVIRGQSPTAGPDPAATAAVQPNSAPAAAGAPAPGSCPEGAYGADGYGGGGGLCLPRHALCYHYKGAENDCCLPGTCFSECKRWGPPVYPTNPSAAAVVQYPYYVCKGPDDFFLQK
jgi:hypothetical protein